MIFLFYDHFHSENRGFECHDCLSQGSYEMKKEKKTRLSNLKQKKFMWKVQEKIIVTNIT